MAHNFLWKALPTALKSVVDNGENGVVSLYSYTTILRMMALDNPDFSETLVREGISLTEPPAHEQLLSVNSCWLQQGEVVPTAATLAGLKALDVEPVEVDFREGTAAARAINAAIEEGTQGRIPEMKPEEALAGELREAIALYLNTLCYTGAWETPFDPRKTSRKNFYAPQGTVTAEFMVSDELFNTVNGYDDLCAATLGNCMQDGETLFCAMMPHEHVSMSQLLNRLSEKGISSWGSAKFELHLPKFIATGETNLSVLFPELVPASMPGLGRGHTQVDIMQKANLKIDENGVEATAATMAMATLSIPRRVVFNRPFLVLILNAQDDPIFAAVVNKPVG
ncbi:serpin family protein [Lewinella cohaerens]|uniref:serpin family protein n=1 Tax=Lewinella cohaerens TaxID=70995 RepID=UPI000373681F|nr:serpin family protein [Lewinella cohaerens]